MSLVPLFPAGLAARFVSGRGSPIFTKVSKSFEPFAFGTGASDGINNCTSQLVHSCMIAFCNYFQILNSVISSNFIFMMNILEGMESSSKVLLHKVTVLSHLFPINCYELISVSFAYIARSIWLFFQGSWISRPPSSHVMFSAKPESSVILPITPFNSAHDVTVISPHLQCQ